MDVNKLNELRKKYPGAALELDLVSGRVSPETGLEKPDHKQDEMQDYMELCVLEVLDVIDEQGHSGFSHGYMLGLLIPLLKGLPITPLTGNDWEWTKSLGGGDYYQNKRCFRVFKDGVDAMALITDSCPQRFYYAVVPEYCQHVNADCNGCWNREIPDELKPILMRDLNAEMAEVHEVVKEAFEGAPVIKDSGDRTEFATGAVRDMREGKGRCDLMPLEVVARMFSEKPMFEDPIIRGIKLFMSNDNDTEYLYHTLVVFCGKQYHGFVPTMLLEVAKHFEEGAKKYGENNWQKGIPPKCYIDSAVRHYLKWLRGDKDEPHDRAFVWNLMCCIWEVDYRPKDEVKEND